MRLIIELVFIELFLISWSSAVRPSVKSTEEDPNLVKSSCNTGQVEYRLTKLEVLTAERGEALKSELRENNRRLQALEWQNSEVVTAIEGFKNEMSRLVAIEHNPVSRAGYDDKNGEIMELKEKIESLSKGIHLAIAAIKLNNAELKSLKQDLISVRNNTENIADNHGHLINKDYFNDAMGEVKHHLIVRHSGNEKCEIQPTDKPRDCVDLQRKGKKSGIYKVYPEDNHKGIMVLCEMETAGGGWAVIQNRYDGFQNFYLGWHDYKHGFGNLGGEFWFGLDNLYRMTGNEINELFIQLVDHTSTGKYAHYGAFSIGSEMEGYSIKLLTGYEGDAGDSMRYHAGSRFSTKDMDQDSWDEGSCARSHNGAWWYKACDEANLNGKYLNGELPDTLIYQGMYWGDFRGPSYSLQKARMMIRPRDKAMDAN
ncbi:angiopoietin-related protein 7-like [Coccinella septempunctata]|uniref:angiopoietin-related protein 7-like n=1 Tax=Coccinella septempunctata TaxID=41139 RepID=UPI001D07EABE|nr:angiopoietin-related protein 7-like [Coccinella septempunctata]